MITDENKKKWTRSQSRKHTKTHVLVVQGQGMTVGVMGSELLAQCVGQHLKGKANSERQQQLAALDGLPVNFHKKLGKLVDHPWTISVGPDAQ